MVPFYYIYLKIIETFLFGLFFGWFVRSFEFFQKIIRDKAIDLQICSPIVLCVHKHQTDAARVLHPLHAGPNWADACVQNEEDL